MKKTTLAFLAALGLALMACGNKTAKTAENSQATDSTATVMVATDTLMSEDAVIRQVKAVYGYFNEIRDYYMQTPPEQQVDGKWASADDRFGTQEWRQLSHLVDSIDRACECGGFFDFGDNGPLSPWLYDCFEGEVSVDSITVQLQGDGIAQAEFLVRDAMSIGGRPMRWQLRVEDGAWRVADIFFIKDDNYDLLKGMKAYVADSHSK